MNHCQSLPGIMAIEYVPCELVQRHSDLKSLASLPVQVLADATPILVKGVATCETVSQYDNNGRVEKTTLRFKALSALPTHCPLAFIVTDVNRRRYLMGLHEAPYPVVSITQSTGTPNGDPAVFAHEITFTARKSLILLG